MKDKICFVVMGYGERPDPISGKKLNLDKVYKEIIKPVAIECGYQCYRGDEIPDSGIIDVSMYYGILDSDLVIADLTTLNSNAIYELGVRHGVRKMRTIVMMEHHDAFFFDLNHVRTLQYNYHSRGKVWNDEVSKMKNLLKERILFLEQQNEKDSPLYTFIDDLCEPQKQSRLQSDENGVPLFERVQSAINARRAKHYSKALELFSDLHTQFPSDTFFRQQKALCTYRLKLPSEQEAYYEALKILSPIADSNDPETAGMIASIHKRLFILTGDNSNLDIAIENLEKVYGMYRGCYNGDNLAFCLDLKASISKSKEDIEELHIEARRIRKDIVERNKDILTEEINTEEEIWSLSTLANCCFALSRPDQAEEYERLFMAKADADMKNTHLEQKERLFSVLKISK